MNTLQQNCVFFDIIGEKLGTIVGDDGTKLQVNETFKTKYSVLYDSLYIVGGTADNQEKFDQNIMEFYYEAYKHYRPIGIATRGQKYIKLATGNNFAGVIFATNNPNFTSEFIAAIAKQRFWNRK